MIGKRGVDNLSKVPVPSVHETVHPNTGSWQPSTPGNNAEGNKYGDTGYADLYNYQIYVMSRAGLGMYDPATKQSSLLRPNLDWTKPCGH